MPLGALLRWRTMFEGRLSVATMLSFILLVTIVPIVAFCFLYVGSMWRSSQDSAYRRALLEAASISADISGVLRDRRDTLGEIAAHTGIVRLQKPSCHELLDIYRRSYPELAIVTIRGTAGEAICSSLAHPLPKLRVDQVAWFREALQANGPYITNVVRGPTTKRWVIGLTQPIRDVRGKTIALLIFSMDARLLSARLLPRTGSVIVQDRAHMVVLAGGSGARWIGRPYPLAQQDLFSGRRIGTFRATDPHGERRIGAFLTITRAGWIVSVAYPEQETLAPALAALRRTIALGGALFLVLLLAIGLTYRAIAFSARDLARTTRRVQSGDTSARAPVHGPKELAVVADQINGMLDSLERQNRDLVSAHERMNLISRATSDIIWDWDIPRDRLTWNEHLQTTLGYAEDELATCAAWLARIEEQDRSRIEGELADLRTSGESRWNGEYRMRRADGSTAFLVDRALVVRDGAGRAVRMVGSKLDATERREIDDQLRQSRKLEAMGQLTGGVAHDFNNLLTVILGNGEALASALSNDRDLQQLAELIVSAADRGAEFIDRLLAFARRQTLSPQAVDLNRLVTGIQPLLRRALPANIELRYSPEIVLGAAHIDPVQLEIALLNLVLNARDALPAGGRIEIATANVRITPDAGEQGETIAAGDFVMLSVSDNGVGMPAEVVERAFEPFFTTKPVGKGSGIGLSMVYGFLEQSKGRVRIESEPGIGTTIRLYIPRATAGEPHHAPQEDRYEDLGGHETILVVEDDPLVRDYVSRYLRKWGYAVLAVPDGKTALQALGSTAEIDLIFTDLAMAGDINGVELVARARDLQPQLKWLYTSGYPNEVVGTELEPDALLLKKPYRPSALAAMIRKALAVDLREQETEHRRE